MNILLKSFGVASRLSVGRIVPKDGRTYASALFIPGNKANEQFALFMPHLDIDERFKDMKKLRGELERRGGAAATIDVEAMAKTWQFYKQLDADRQLLEDKREEVGRKTKALIQKKDLSGEEEIEKNRLTIRGRTLKRELRIVKEALWEMEEDVIVRALSLPNTIHKKTPSKDAIVLQTVGEKREPSTRDLKSNLEIGISLGMIDYKNPFLCYLCNEAALFEFAVLNYASDRFVDEGTMKIAGTDFARSLLIEGAGLDHEDPMKSFVLRNNENIDRNTSNRLHLVGGASHVAFLAMHTKRLINPNDFPLKYFSTGRQYLPPDVDANDATLNDGLFGICQSSVVHVFTMAKDPLSLVHDEEFDKLLNNVTSLYDSLDVHYRVVLRPANELRPSESLRISFEMWSANSRRYVEVGHLSMCDRYLSKRLLIAYQTPTGRDFPAIISGTVLSIPRFLGCLLEEDPKKFRIPKKIAEYMI